MHEILFTFARRCVFYFVKFESVSCSIFFVQPMKWIVFIWAVYLLSLSVVPCSDAYNNCNPSSPPSAATANTEHHHDNDTDDTCTPFCHCACCSISIVLVQKMIPLVANTSFLFQLPAKTPINTAFLSRYDSRIWQPPRA